MYLEITVTAGSEKYAKDCKECSMQFNFKSINAEKLKEMANTIISDMVIDAYAQHKDLIISDLLQISITNPERERLPF